MFELVNGLTIRASDSRIATAPKGIGNRGRGEKQEGCVIGVRFIKAPTDKSGTGVGVVGGDGVELLVEDCDYCKRACVGSVVERDRLVLIGGNQLQNPSMTSLRFLSISS